MTDSIDTRPAKKGPTISILPFRRSKWTKGSILHFPPVPHEFYEKVGAVAVLHGELERYLDRLITAATSAAPAPDDAGWDKRSLPKRCSHLERKVRILFADDPLQLTKLNRLIDEIRLRHVQRNILVHGQYIGIFPDSTEAPAAIIIRAKPYRDYVNFDASADDIETVYHELSMLIGSVRNLCDEKPDHIFSSVDRQKLRAKLLSHLQPLSSPPAYPRLPLSSPRKSRKGKQC